VTSSAWLSRLVALTLTFGAVTLWRSQVVGVELRDPHGQYFIRKLLVSLGLFALLVIVDSLVRGARPRHGRRAWAAMRQRWTWQRLINCVAALVCYHVVYISYRNLKSWNAFNTPRDALLAGVDHWLFLGHNPAVLLHDLLGQGIAAWILIGIYESFSTLVTVSLVAAVALTNQVRDGAVFVAAMCWTWILGTASYYAVPSVGPFQDRPQDFASLPTSTITRTQAEYLAQRDDLLADPSGHDAFAQISAFASLHVAVTTVVVLMAAYFGLRRSTVALSVFLVGTLLATVYLGWHFVIDDVAGLAIGILAVALGRLTVEPRKPRWRRPVCAG
jgi:hypothetical protein